MPVEKLENCNVAACRRGFRWDADGAGTAPHPDTRANFHPMKNCGSFCNLGYAEGCGRLPGERAWDSVRFAVLENREREGKSAGGRIQIRYVCEREHRPAEHGTLEFDAVDAHVRRAASRPPRAAHG